MKKAVGFEGDPNAYAAVYANLEGNSHRIWYNHTFVYPVAVTTGHNEDGAKRVSMRSGSPGNSCSGMKNLKIHEKSSGRGKASWDTDGYTLPHLLRLNGIPFSKDTFIKIDVESYECELIPSWLNWLQNYWTPNSNVSMFIILCSFPFMDKPDVVLRNNTKNKDIFNDVQKRMAS